MRVATSRIQSIVSALNHVARLLAVIAGLTSGLLIAQSNPVIDSLVSLARSDAPDSVRIQAYATLGSARGYLPPDSCQAYAFAARRLAMASGRVWDQVETTRQIGVFYKNTGRLEGSICWLLEALKLVGQTGDTLLEARIMNNLGTSYNRFAMQDSGLYYLHGSLVRYQAAGDTRGLFGIHNNLGVFYSSRSEHDRAKDHFLTALDLAQQLGSDRDIYRSWENVGNACYMLGEKDSAVQYFELALNGASQVGDNISIAGIRQNLGNVKYDLGQYDEAETLLRKSIDSKVLEGNPDRLVLAWTNLGLIYVYQGKFLQGLETLSTALAITEQYQLWTRQRSIHDGLAQAYGGLGNSAKAAEHYQKYTELLKAEFSSETSRAVKELEIKFETERTEKELALSRQNELLAKRKEESATYQRNFTLLVSAFLALLLAGGLMAYRARQRDNRLLQVQKATIEKREQEKSLLLRELHHRVKNNLQMISSLLRLQSSQLQDTAAAVAVQEGQARVEAMAMIHRELYHKEEKTRVNLQTYVGKLVDNLVFAYSRETGPVQVHKRLDDLEVDPDLAIPLGLMINELVTNSLKYGLPKADTPVLKVVLNRGDDEILLVKIADNGPGITIQADQSDSFGMKMVRSMIRQVKGEFHLETNAGTLATLRIPLRPDQTLYQTTASWQVSGS